ncbi:hypothetical protein DL764_007662 [Monosporascus ibericus]|uniref:Methyltransferase type 12 domain-containing protein n=1 Tax=Monosporascus ibericus TaxID=155417 RepID=A0A4Q4T2M0_9PEZI|nr:hypothetical protein DL764_007662 [Monosporascus ibericus]
MAGATGSVGKEGYDTHAATYEKIATTPSGILEEQLLASAMGDCTGLAVLDLGGGTGLRARQAVKLGASHVDVVDVSPEMLRIGQQQTSSEYDGRIAWHEADVSKPLDDKLQLRKTYDLVMANWVLDSAGSLADLEGMWANVGARLRPGGRYVGIRVNDPWAPYMADGRYGVRFREKERIPGGVRYWYIFDDPAGNKEPVEIEGASLEISYSGSTELHTKYGLCDVEIEPFENAKIVREDPEFWKPFLDRPLLAVVKARKQGGE